MIVGISASLLRISKEADPGDYVLLLTLGVLILYTYYTYILAVTSKESIRSPALLKAQEMHTDDLKGLLDTWKSSIEKTEIIDGDICDSSYNPSEISINGKLYDDLYKYHLPLLPEGPGLQQNWSEFQDLVNSYIKFYINFYDNLSQNITRRVEKKTSLDIEPHFLNLIYEQHTYYWSNDETKKYPSDFYKIEYNTQNTNQLRIATGQNANIAGRLSGILVAEGDEYNIKKLVEIHEDFDKPKYSNN